MNEDMEELFGLLEKEEENSKNASGGRNTKDHSVYEISDLMSGLCQFDTPDSTPDRRWICKKVVINWVPIIIQKTLGSILIIGFF